ncbi:MAG: response regulator transcription factor [Saprospiraceae bacterium]|nr:response regulator transcription factor [Saprospiraceae bacterium]
MSARILIVEDEPIIAADIESTLLSQGYEVAGIANSAVQALDMIVNRGPDMVILDIAIKGEMDGVSIAQLLRKKYFLPFIYLTSFSDKETLEKVKPTLPYGYIVKPFKDRDLLAAIELALYRHVQEQSHSELTQKKAEAVAGTSLTNMEYRILSLLWEGKANQSIAQELFVSINTVKTHIKNIFEKFEANSRNELIVKLR